MHIYLRACLGLPLLLACGDGEAPPLTESSCGGVKDALEAYIEHEVCNPSPSWRCEVFDLHGLAARICENPESRTGRCITALEDEIIGYCSHPNGSCTLVAGGSVEALANRITDTCL